MNASKSPQKGRAFASRALSFNALSLSASLAVGIVAPADAFEFDTGNPDLAVRWDNTFRYTLAQRVGSQKDSLLASPNYDDGDRNFDKGIVGNRLDILSELDLSYKDMTGFRVSAAGWYDDAYQGKSSDNDSVATTNNTKNGQPKLGYNDYVKRYYAGPSGEILDAFVFYNTYAGDIPVSMKLGRSVEYWGEALFTNTNGISYAQMPIDGGKAIAIPGIELKEVFRPITNLTVRFSPTDTLTVAGQYFLDWEESRTPEPGTYLGAVDFAGHSGEMLRAGPFNVFRKRDITPKKHGEYGLSVRWDATDLQSTFGFYYRKLSDKTGQLHLSDFRSPAPGVVVPGSYFLAYADDIDLYGISWSKQIAGVSVGAEVSYRTNMPLSSEAIPVVNIADTPSRGETNGARGNTWHALVNGIYSMPTTSIYDTLTLQGEVVWNRWDKVTKNEAVFKGRSGYNGIDKVTRDFYGITVTATPTWLQVFPGVDLSMPISFNTGLSGVSSVAGGGNEDAGSGSIGVSADINQRHKVELKYTTYFGDYNTDLVTHAVTEFSGGTALLKDRDFVALTFKTTY